MREKMKKKKKKKKKEERREKREREKERKRERKKKLFHYSLGAAGRHCKGAVDCYANRSAFFR